MEPLRLELFEHEPGYYGVIAGDKFASNLGRDEALGVVAALLFGGVQRAPYLHDYAGWHAWQQRYSRDQPVANAPLLSWNGAQR